MKTYEEFRREVMSDIKRAEEMSLKPKEYSYAQIETIAAKEYAKQWVYHALSCALETHFIGLVDSINKKIDAQ